MLSFAARRLLAVVPVLAGMTVFVFLLIHLAPGDPVTTMLGPHATEENIAATRAQLNLDQPLPTQYLGWLGGVLRGDLGQDLIRNTPVATLLGTHLPVTLELTILANLVGVTLGVLSGILSAARPGVVRRMVSGLSTIGISIPYFWLGLMLSLVFAGLLGILPSSGYVPFAEDPLGHLSHMVLPVLALGLGEAAYLAQVTQGIVSHLLKSPSITFLRAKGVRQRVILFKHALRQSSAPIVTVIGIDVGTMLGGAIITESIFGLPGLGSLVIGAIEQRNYTVVQGCVLVISIMFVLVTLLADLVVAMLDPRVAGGEA
jgi:peptide/nickel transport system permease protein